MSSVRESWEGNVGFRKMLDKQETPAEHERAANVDGVAQSAQSTEHDGHQ